MPCSGTAGSHGQILYNSLEDCYDDFQQQSPVEQSITSFIGKW
jgi:hypothetical protein